jgi:probable HAF family extracellular repeat protein
MARLNWAQRERPLVLERLEDRCLLTYMITDLGTLGGDASSATAINAAGQVAGWILIGDSQFHAALWKNGSMTDLGTLEGGTGKAEAHGINNLGQVVGFSSATGFLGFHAFLYDNGAMQDLSAVNKNVISGYGINDKGQIAGGTMVNSETHAYFWDFYSSSLPNYHDLGTLTGYPLGQGLGINASGQVFGTAVSGTGSYRSFFVSNGVLQDIGSLGGAENFANGMNDLGYVVGTTQAANGAFHGYVWHNGNMLDLGIYGLFACIGDGINNLGQVVGTGGPNFDPFLWQHGVMTDLTTLIDPPLDWKWIGPTAINDAGLIVGYGYNASGQEHAFLLTPDGSSSSSGGLRLDSLLLAPWANQAAQPPAAAQWTASNTDYLVGDIAPVILEPRIEPLATSGASRIPLLAPVGEHVADAVFADPGTDLLRQPAV